MTWCPVYRTVLNQWTFHASLYSWTKHGLKTPWFLWRFTNIPPLPPPSSSSIPKLPLSLSNPTFSAFHSPPTIMHPNCVSNSGIHSLWPLFLPPILILSGSQKLEYRFAPVNMKKKRERRKSQESFWTCRQTAQCTRKPCSWLSAPCLLHSLAWSTSWAIPLPLRFVNVNRKIGSLFIYNKVWLRN